MPEPGNTEKVTLADVAKRAGVSVMTASYTYSRPSRVSAASRRKVLSAAEVLGYAGPDPSARSLRRGTSGALGVVLGETLPYAFEDPQAARFLAGIADVCAEHRLAMTILPTNGSADDSSRIRAAAVDGFVVWTTTDDDPVLEALSLTGKPVVIHAGPERQSLGFVGIDDRAAARAVAALGLRGSRNAAVIAFPSTKERLETLSNGPDPLASTFPVTRNRLLGFQDAVAAAGFDWNQVPVAFCSTNAFSDGARAAQRLLDGPGTPDLFLTMSDELALGALQAVEANGIAVPSQLALTGWDASAAGTDRGLTSVYQDLREQGAASAQAAIQGLSQSAWKTWKVVSGRTTR
ncbi:LacI family DNA-binding transcriptional regulator [Arthrobacter zhaoxinii]|uniref:LacI family DNA-binding transcriptional regulator n=1 Tax=Arthrobacter zhaoxinii TaxID=2964616 RepID=A0ABY5YTI9_9MICC|nr:LacI family DNA-binding transcriptional regulator [Arthrobacter zhaoxinii]UWX98439.1 LacI family DNA-binding transcriptional regulator [Arthrobacter zhaoxinii]